MDEIQAAQQQDGLRSLRMFVGLANATLNDQSWGGADGVIAAPPYRFTSIGPYSSSIEGLPITVQENGALVVSPVLMWVGVGVGLLLLMKGRK